MSTPTTARFHSDFFIDGVACGGTLRHGQAVYLSIVSTLAVTHTT